MVGQSWQQRPPVPYWDLWPAGPRPSEDEVSNAVRDSIKASSIPCTWHFFGMDVFNEQTIATGNTIETDVFCKNLGWIYKVEAIAVTASESLFLTCSDSSTGRKLFEDVCTWNISGGDLGKSYASFAYILGPRCPLHFKLTNDDNRGGVVASVILLGKLYRGEL